MLSFGKPHLLWFLICMGVILVSSHDPEEWIFFIINYQTGHHPGNFICLNCDLIFEVDELGSILCPVDVHVRKLVPFVRVVNLDVVVDIHQLLNQPNLWRCFTQQRLERVKIFSRLSCHLTNVDENENEPAEPHQFRMNFTIITANLIPTILYHQSPPQK